MIITEAVGNLQSVRYIGFNQCNSMKRMKESQSAVSVLPSSTQKTENPDQDANDNECADYQGQYNDHRRSIIVIEEIHELSREAR